MPVRSFALLTLICLLWALNVVVSKVIVDTLAVPPLAYAALRSLVVAVALIPWLRPIPDRLALTLVTGLAISGGSFALLFIGLQTSTPASASIVGLIGAPLTVVFAMLWLGEQVRWRRAIGIVLTLIGVGLAILDAGRFQASGGLILVAVSALIGAIGSVLLKTLDISAIRIQAWAGIASLIVLAPMSLASEPGASAAIMAAGWRFWALLGFSAIVVSIIAHTLYFRMLQQHDANLIAPLTLMTPAFAVALGAWLTNDPVGWQLIIGGLIAMAGVLIIAMRPSATLFKPMLVKLRL